MSALDEKIKQKKEEIAACFMKYFKNYGMRNTIVADVATELKMSKKTIYKYFAGGKQDALYYFFKKIADEYIKEIDKNIDSIKSHNKKVEILINEIFKLSKPYVVANVAEETDYIEENEIVGAAFRDVFQPSLEKIIFNGINKEQFNVSDVNLTIKFIYGILLESMKIIHKEPERNIEKSALNAILKLLQ